MLTVVPTSERVLTWERVGRDHDRTPDGRFEVLFVPRDQVWVAWDFGPAGEWRKPLTFRAASRSAAVTWCEGRP